MELEKLLNNRITTNLVGSTITEYDLKSAHTTALYYLKGETIYNELSSTSKTERNIRIGCMIRDDRQLRTDIDNLVLSWFNMFLKENKISKSNFLATTPDSILIKNQIPTKTTFNDGRVYFRNKEKISYTSLFIIDKNKFILFDRMSKRIRIKGLGIEEKTDKYAFVSQFLKKLCCILDDSLAIGRIDCLRKLKQLRINYLTGSNKEIYRSVDDDNKYKYELKNEIVLSDVYLEETVDCKLIISDNYINYVLPLIRSFI